MNRRLRFPLWALAVAALGLGGCEDDDAPELAGTWQAATLVFTDVAGTRTESPLPATWAETLVLNLDGSFAFTTMRAGRTQAGRGTWRESGGGLVLAGNRETFRSYRFSGKALIVSGEIPEGAYALIWRKTAGAR